MEESHFVSVPCQIQMACLRSVSAAAGECRLQAESKGCSSFARKLARTARLGCTSSE